jgi:PmbA protein
MTHSEDLYGDVLADFDKSIAVVAGILDEAKRQGATDAEVGLSKDAGMSIQVRDKQAETIEYNRDGGFAITVYLGDKKGSSTTSDVRESSIKKAVTAAMQIAQQASEDPYAGLVDASLLAKEIPELDLCHPWKTNAEHLINQGVICEQAAYEKDIEQVDSVNISSHIGLKVYGNSLGFLEGFPMSRHSLSCVAIAKDQQGNMQRDHYYTTSRIGPNLEDAASIGLKAAERTIERLNPQILKTNKVPILFVPDVAKGIWGHFLSAIRGSSLYRNSSFLKDSLGTQIFPNWIEIKEQPHLLRALGSSPFDNEGVATYDKSFVKGGIVESYILNSYSARRLGMQTTGNAGGIHNCIIPSSGQSFSELLKQMGTGVVVTDVMGQGVNMVTGDYSRGFSGFWVEHGEIQFPINEMTIASNLKDMFSSIVAVGNDIDTRSGLQTGSILIQEMTVAGN